MRLLLIEDNLVCAQSMTRLLAPLFVVDVVYKGKEGLYQAQVNTYDIILLDLDLPDISGDEVCTCIRSFSSVPLIVLTANAEIPQKVHLLTIGADDYVTKPVHAKELLARIRAVLRRPAYSFSEKISVHDLVLDPLQRTVQRAGIPVALRRKEFDILEHLLRHSNKVIRRAELAEHVWGEVDSILFTNTLDVHIKSLRDKLNGPSFIKTVRGVGYMLQGEEVS